MIDKITPRPSEAVRAMLQDAGVEDMDIVVTDKQTYIAPFVNAEEPQYLVVENAFPQWTSGSREGRGLYDKPRNREQGGADEGYGLLKPHPYRSGALRVYAGLQPLF